MKRNEAIKLTKSLKNVNNELDGVISYLKDLYKKQGGSLNLNAARTLNACVVRNDRMIAKVNAVDKHVLKIEVSHNISSQPELYNIIKDLRVMDDDEPVSLPYYIADVDDSDYKQGVDRANGPAYDGKYHDFGKGKWQLSGDNAPCSLRQAIQQVLEAINGNIVFKDVENLD